MAYFLTIIALVLCTRYAEAKDLGVQGHLFPIAEENLLNYLQKKLQSLSSDQVSDVQQRIKKRYLTLAHEPNAVGDIQEATVYSTHFFDPTIHASKDIKDHEGKVVISKGTQVNPLNTCQLTKTLLFLDGTQLEHIQWAKQQGSCTQWILIKGRPIDLESKENVPVYFDQFGALTRKLKIKHVPAKVVQEGQRLKVEEIPLGKL